MKIRRLFYTPEIGGTRKKKEKKVFFFKLSFSFWLQFMHQIDQRSLNPSQITKKIWAKNHA